MTLPSSKFGPVLLDPDRLAELSHKHVSFDEPHEAVRRTPMATNINGQYQDAKRKEAHRMALAYMGTNETKAKQRLEARPWKYDQKRVGLAPFGRSEGIYNATKNPYLKAAPVNEYRDSAATYEGGVLSTKQGQVYKAKRLQGRVQEMNVRDSVTEPVGQTVPTNSRLSAVESTPPEVDVKLEDLLNNYSNVIDANLFTSDSLTIVNALYRFLQSDGVKLTSDTLVRLLRYFDPTLQSIFYILSLAANNAQEGGLNAERFKIADAMLVATLKIRALVKGLVGVVDRSMKERRMALPSIIQAANDSVPRGAETGRERRLAELGTYLDAVGLGRPEGEESEEEDVEGGACACKETPKPTKPRKRASKKKV